jgi:hypothetical protein
MEDRGTLANPTWAYPGRAGLRPNIRRKRGADSKQGDPFRFDSRSCPQPGAHVLMQRLREPGWQGQNGHGDGQVSSWGGASTFSEPQACPRFRLSASTRKGETSSGSTPAESK